MLKGDRFSSTGTLTVEVKTEQAVNKLLQGNSLAGVVFAESVPVAYMANIALIKGIPTFVTKKQIMKAPQNQGVTHARTHVRRHISEAEPAAEVVVSFRLNTE